jgi:hypothetical protein
MREGSKGRNRSTVGSVWVEASGGPIASVVARARTTWKRAGLGADSGDGVGWKTGPWNGGRPVELKPGPGFPER